MSLTPLGRPGVRPSQECRWRSKHAESRDSVHTLRHGDAGLGNEYHAATGTFQVVIDREVDARYLPSVISGERVSFLPTGTADAYVDFAGLGDGAVSLSPDGTSATIELPAPRLGKVRIDPGESRVLDRDRGLVERVGDALGDNPVDDSGLYELAENRLAAAAAQSDMRERAETNTRAMLTGLSRSLGVDRVKVTFEEAADSAG
ncbi:MAG: DUF4230 domain-containing protein [Chloroflexota bacterium]|nr:DUF4230 domain-containing protein [Chloroflexota bacterium]